MLTTFAYGRSKLPAPILSSNTEGSIPAGTYYVWLKAKNRAGFNEESNSATITLANTGSIIIASSSFTVLPWEDWRSVVVSVSNENNYSTSRILYRQWFFEENQTTPVVVSNVEIDSYPTELAVATVAALPSDALDGVRWRVTGLDAIYEYRSTSTLPTDDLYVLPAAVGRWLYVPNQVFVEVEENYNKNLATTNPSEDDVELANISLDNPIGIKYYLINNELSALATGQLFLTSFISDPSIRLEIDYRILGYVNFVGSSLDTTGISFINDTLRYSEAQWELSKPLPAGQAVLVEITPQIINADSLLPGTEFNLYPRINNYQIIEDPAYWDAPVADLAGLAGVVVELRKPNQIRFVVSKNLAYRYDSLSDAAANGDGIILPAEAPALGRWIALSSSVADGSITAAKLNSSVLALLSTTQAVKELTVALPGTYTLDLDLESNLGFEYFIINTPIDDGIGTPTTINVLKNTEEASNFAVIVEIRQKTSVVELHSSFLTPKAEEIIFSGNNKTDMLILTFTEDSSIIKKRAFFRADIG